MEEVRILFISSDLIVVFWGFFFGFFCITIFELKGSKWRKNSLLYNIWFWCFFFKWFLMKNTTKITLYSMSSFSGVRISGFIKFYVSFRLCIYYKSKGRITPLLTVQNLHCAKEFYILLSAYEILYGDLTLRVGHLCFWRERSSLT